jgi:LEA14-like dessication related protein
MSTKGKIIIWFLVATLLAVVSYLVVQLNKISNAALVYAGMKVRSVSLNKIEIIAYFKLTNTGSASVNVSNQEYDVYINGKYVSHMKNASSFTIAPGENIIPIDVTISLADLLKAGISNISQILTDKDKIDVSLKGKRSLKIGPLAFNNVAIDETFNLGSV